MTPTAGEKARAAIQRRKERLRRKKHALAQTKYRERVTSNADALREKARESMRRHRAAIKSSEEKTKAAWEQRREVDADYRERWALDQEIWSRKLRGILRAAVSPARQEHEQAAVRARATSDRGSRGGASGNCVRAKEMLCWCAREIVYEMECANCYENFKAYPPEDARLASFRRLAVTLTVTHLRWTTMPTTIRRVPPAIQQLSPAPTDFTPCRLKKSFAANFDNHEDFSRNGSKTYWVCFSEGREAVFTLKLECVAAKEWGDVESDVVASFACWTDVLRVWTAFCYHHHGKCDQHPKICGLSVCPAHLPRPHRLPALACTPTVERRVKVERTPLVKSGRATPKVQIPHHTPSTGSRARASTRGTVRPSPVDEDDDYAAPPGTVPLYDPDTPPPRPVRDPSYEVPLYGADTDEDDDAATSTKRGPSGHSESRQRSRRAPSGAVSSAAAPSPETSVTVSSASSLSASTANASSGVEKGKGRASPLPLRSHGSSISGAARRGHYRGATAPPVASSSTARRAQAGGSTSTAGSPDVSPDGVFYVSAGGLITRNRAEGLRNLQDGAVKVVVGWDAAADYAERMATLGAEGEDLMNVDN
ncbi:hypothetical protein B0H16DRAFT_1479699 [Mycena metata]|uniref:Uncharacterized protein n=1 Tax=Mycena metata TaxID=1033252 RepID=A0AAD7ME29_9AGAR|nr:hypothetical protein B0H16DRAFT_1479699 [Mycena metata]